MTRFLLGCVVGCALAVGLLMGVQEYRRSVDPCLDLCGAGTRCELSRCRVLPVAATLPVPPPPVVPPKIKRPVARKDEPVSDGGVLHKPSPEDWRVGVEGDDLRRAVTRLDFVPGEGKEALEQEDLDLVWGRRRGDVQGCIKQAAATTAAPVETRVEVAFRIEATGEVRGVRIEAPQLLLRNGLSACVRPLVEGLRFPRSGRSTQARYSLSVR